MDHHHAGSVSPVIISPPTGHDLQLALCTWTVSFGSSAYTGGIQGTILELKVSDDVALLGISLYVLGFALGCVARVFPPNFDLMKAQSSRVCSYGRGKPNRASARTFAHARFPLADVWQSRHFRLS